MARIYIETTVVSFYFNARPEPEMVSRQNWTRRWLDAAIASSDELVTSLAVENELNGGQFPNQSDMLELAGKFPLLDLNDSVAEAVEAYIANHVMPNDPGGDALHLAVASLRLSRDLELPTHRECKQIRPHSSRKWYTGNGQSNFGHPARIA